MGTTAEKLTYLNTTKQNLKTVINTTGAGLTDESTFRSYANVLNDKILGAINGDVDLFEEYPKVSGNGADLSLNGVVEGKMSITPQGVSSQDGEPTPTTPIPVNSVTGENSLVLQNDNLFDVNDITRGYELQPDGRTNAKPNWYVSDYIKVTPNTHYYLSGTKTSGQTNNFYDIDKNIISYVNKLTGLLTTPNDCYYVRFNGLLTQLLDISFVKGSTAPTTYVEHEEQNYQLSLDNIELKSSPDGTIRDQIVGKPNEWYKREYIGKVVLDGSESWTFVSNSAMKFSLNINGIAKPVNQNTLPNMLSDNFRQSTWNNAINSDDDYLMVVSTSNEILRIKDNDFSTLADFKAWLSTHNTTIYYPLAEYIDIPITDATLINQLNDIYNNAHSYNGVTNITTTYEDGNEQMYLDIEVLKDIEI